ncbi:unnamed protein product [Onchocerca flexuosa]|uniref:LRRcap domain-containing protein n=1 Tax=Onchocerca flexuosa TaxID=387005 RepID=A0A183HG95_9BILA|nr:unnamed protein product [Onchocerca flexuosa]
MHNNRVQQIMPNIGEVLPSLKTLALTNNNLCELGDIDPLVTCKKLEYLTLIGNPLTHKPQYRLYVIYKLPSVRVLDFKRVRLAERKQADSLFKGKKGQKFRNEVVKKSKVILDDEEDRQSRNLGVEDVKKIEAKFFLANFQKFWFLNIIERNSNFQYAQFNFVFFKEAIASASSLAEVERLQAILQSGRIPERDWNHESIGDVTDEFEKNAKESNGFVAEQEDGNDDIPSPANNDVPLPADDDVPSPYRDDVNDDIQSPAANPPQEVKLMINITVHVGIQ